MSSIAGIDREIASLEAQIDAILKDRHDPREGGWYDQLRRLQEIRARWIEEGMQ
jgi:hypothetical protein